MTVRETTRRGMAEEFNFLVTNRIPRRLATSLIGWLSHIEQPLVARVSIGIWRLFCAVDLSEAEETRFPSMHACFIRTLRPGARRFETAADEIASPSDAIVGALGTIAAGEAHQIKGAPYAMSELLGDERAAQVLEGGRYVTLRLTAGMYHRFHAPDDLTVETVRYISGDCWNVNTPALKRVERLFCRNERAVVTCRLADGTPLALVAVAAVLVASIRLTFLDTPALIRDGGPREISVGAKLAKGAEMGWFEHGSTIIVLAPGDCGLADGIETGRQLRAGESLLQRYS
jgi:phosphatidylserine decarboxylase